MHPYTYNHRGEWGENKRCPENMAICGIKVRMAGSSTAMNGAKFQCCELPISLNTTSPNTTHHLNDTISLTQLPTEPTLPVNSTSQGIRCKTKKGKSIK